MSLRRQLGKEMRKASTKSTKSAPATSTRQYDTEEIILIPNEPTKK